MSKQTKIESINTLIKRREGPERFMKLFIYMGPGADPRYYKQVPWETNIDVICIDEAGADSLAAYLTRLQSGASVIEYIVP